VTSERQKAANQANARRSTGPKTPKGKAVVRLNALRHGLLTRDLVLPGEDADAFEDLLNQIRADLLPVGPIEELLADRVVNTLWRLGRLARAETALFDWRVRVFKVGQIADQVRSYEVTFPDVFRPHITDKAAHTEATEALAQAKHERDQDKVLLGRALDADAKEGDVLGKLARYERSLERSLLRTLDELRQLQDRRRNRPSPRFWMPLRWPQEIQNDELSADLRIPANADQSTHCGPAFARSVSGFVAGENFLFCQTKPFIPPEPGIEWLGPVADVRAVRRRAAIAVLPSTYGEGAQGIARGSRLQPAAGCRRCPRMPRGRPSW
jgi:hypothetical protein